VWDPGGGSVCGVGQALLPVHVCRSNIAPDRQECLSYQEPQAGKLTGYRDAAAVDLGGFWWYQKQAGLAGVSSKFWRALRFT
jgi:hypothetical protein